MNILGINCPYHESSACLLVDGRLVMLAEEERFNRVKHAKEARVDNADELPVHALTACMRHAGLSWPQVDAVAFSFDPPGRLRNIGLGEAVEPGGWGDEAGERRFAAGLARLPERLAALGCRAPLHWMPHQACHAASAAFASPFERAAVLTLDGIGEFSSGVLGEYDRGGAPALRLTGEVEYPASLGFVWEKVSAFLGFSPYDACKVMGMAAYGDPERFRGAFRLLLAPEVEGTYRVDRDVWRFRTAEVAPLERAFGIASREVDGALLPEHYDLAAALQAATEEVVLHLARRLHRRHPFPDLALAGGVALNCVCNGRLLAEGPFQRVYAPPATHDAGTAAGAAFLLWNAVPGRRPPEVPPHAYLGPGYPDADLRAALDESGLAWEESGRIEERVAELIAAGAVVGWFQGAMEAGPRALGNRSLLADPRNPGVRDLLNLKVKHREPFRPFAPSVPEEVAAEWFELPSCRMLNDFMLAACRVRPDRRARIPAVVHEDGTARVQTVREETNPRFHRLLRAFGERTGVPVLLNTSFNDCEPIVCSPEDAVRTYLKTGIDVLVLGNFLALKHRAAWPH